MGTIALTELGKLSHLNLTDLHGRAIRILPVWDGVKWNAWVGGSDGKAIEIKVADAVHAKYLSKVGPAKDNDTGIPVIEFLWQRASWPELINLINAIEDDFHLLATSAAKLEHFHANRRLIDSTLIGSFVKTELEYMLVVARSVFDLLQEIISTFWNGRIDLHDPAADAIKKQRQLPPKFSKIIFEKTQPRTAGEIQDRFSIPSAVAEIYVKHSNFFSSLRISRDEIIHGNSSVGAIFVTEKGFCVDPNSKLCRHYPWTTAHQYNDNVVSLMPWVAQIVFQTVGACSEIVEALNSVIPFPEEIAPGYRVYFRDPANDALIRLMESATGKRVWWNEEICTNGPDSSITPNFFSPPPTSDG